jgi:uncharacterized membrane protein
LFIEACAAGILTAEIRIREDNIMHTKKDLLILFSPFISLINISQIVQFSYYDFRKKTTSLHAFTSTPRMFAEVMNRMHIEKHCIVLNPLEAVSKSLNLTESK